jgi:hypothetical protein
MPRRTSHALNMPAGCVACTASSVKIPAMDLFVIWPPLKRVTLLPEAMNGEMAEWSKARAWKVRIPVKGYRGFESLSLRHGMTSGVAAGSSAMATNRACSGEWTALMTPGRNGRGHAMKPPLRERPTAGRPIPVTSSMATRSTCKRPPIRLYLSPRNHPS